MSPPRHPSNRPGRGRPARPNRRGGQQSPGRPLPDNRGEDQEIPLPRLQKVLANAGVASRRACEELIVDGRVEVDRKVVSELGTRVDPMQQEIRVDGSALKKPRKVYYAVNKPPGVVSTNSDPDGRLRVIDLLGENQRLFTVGRLDRTSEGLILVTNDGDFANQMTHPRFGIAKRYEVRVVGNVDRAAVEQIKEGVYLSEGRAQVDSIRVKRKHRDNTDLIIVLKEGRNREIRRILAKVGHKVLRLKRTAVGGVTLDDVPVGAYRKLAPEEVRMLLSSARPSSPRPAKKPYKQRSSAGPKTKSKTSFDGSTKQGSVLFGDSSSEGENKPKRSKPKHRPKGASASKSGHRRPQRGKPRKPGK